MKKKVMLNAENFQKKRKLGITYIGEIACIWAFLEILHIRHITFVHTILYTDRKTKDECKS